MSVIRFQNVFKDYDSKPVLREVFFRLEARDRVGLVGKNGAGKTTVLRLILNAETPSEGQVELDEGIRIGYFSQFSELSGSRSIRDVLEDVFADVRAIAEQLREIEAALAQSPAEDDLKRLLAQYDVLMAEMARLDGWTYENRIETALSKLGFDERYRHMPVDQLSGGWRNRAALAKILLTRPDVLLLDEPTNFLDFEGIVWLEQWLNGFTGAAIVVSHDRQFLDRTANRIVEIENYHFQLYDGGFSDYVRNKQVRTKQRERQFQYEEELLAYEAEAIRTRREDARDPSQALKRRLANIKRKVEPRSVDGIVTDLYAGMRVPNELCEVDALFKAYDDRILFCDLSFALHRGDRLVVMGPNGCGKTTLLRLLRGEETADDGRVVWKPGVVFADYNAVFDALDPNDTVSHAVNVVGLAYSAPRRKVHQFLHLLRFSEMDLYQKISTLSGGQKARVALAQCLVSGAPAVILDEPTNHLDLTSTQVMERALVHFPGAVITASHDRFFIDKVATRLLVFDGQGDTTLVEGNWTVWEASRKRAEEA